MSPACCQDLARCDSYLVSWICRKTGICEGVWEEEDLWESLDVVGRMHFGGVSYPHGTESDSKEDRNLEEGNPGVHGLKSGQSSVWVEGE
jgi:hypothetical protein